MIAALGALVLSSQSASDTVTPTALPAFLESFPLEGTETFVNGRTGVPARFQKRSPVLRVGEFSGAVPEDVDLRIGSGQEVSGRPKGTRERFEFGENVYRISRNGVVRELSVISDGQIFWYELEVVAAAVSEARFRAMYDKITALLGPPSLVDGYERPAEPVKLREWWNFGPRRPDPDLSITGRQLPEGLNARLFVWAWGSKPFSIMGTGDGSDGPSIAITLKYSSASVFRAPNQRLGRQVPNRIEFRIGFPTAID